MTSTASKVEMLSDEEMTKEVTNLITYLSETRQLGAENLFNALLDALCFLITAAEDSKKEKVLGYLDEIYESMKDTLSRTCDGMEEERRKNKISNNKVNDQTQPA